MCPSDSVMHSRLRPPSDLSEIPIPPELDDIVLRCLEKKAEDRFQSVSDLEATLRDLFFEDPWDRARAREWWQLHGGMESPSNADIE